MSAVEPITPAQLAEILDVTEAKVMEWRRVYNWPHVKIGRTFRFTPQQVEQIIASHSVKPSATTKPSGPVKIAGQTARSARRAS